jgi:hypothetical protein
MGIDGRRFRRLPGTILIIAVFLSVFAGLSVADGSAEELARVDTAPTAESGILLWGQPSELVPGLGGFPHAAGVPPLDGDAEPVRVMLRSAVSERLSGLRYVQVHAVTATAGWPADWVSAIKDQLADFAAGGASDAAAGDSETSSTSTQEESSSKGGTRPDASASSNATSTQTSAAGLAGAGSIADPQETDDGPGRAATKDSADERFVVPVTSAPATTPVPTTSVTAPPTTTAPATAPPVLPAAVPAGRTGLTANEVVDQALAMINYPWQNLGIRIEVHGPNPALAGEAFTDRIDVYVSPDQSVADVAWIIAHELGHVVDYQYNDTVRRAEYLAMRGVGGVPADYQSWTGGGPGTTRAAASEDYADVFAVYLMGNLNWTSNLAGAPSQGEAQAFSRFFWP